ncbi:MAG: hypothetical protein H6713_02315 [Myxococcales bacterium]|nr:hypothetical protein [Myxococcales bacterium]
MTRLARLRAIAPAIASVCACFHDAGSHAAGPDTLDADTRATETSPLTGTTEVGATAVSTTSGAMTSVDATSEGASGSTTAAMTSSEMSSEMSSETASASSGCDASAWYGDADADGWGADDDVVWACAAPEGYAAQGGDCDDLAPETNPGADELCDLFDNDCDGLVDEWAPTLDVCGACSLFEYSGSVYWVCGAVGSWMIARVACQERGGELASLTSAAENSYVAARLKLADAPYWIGMSDAAREGSWIWPDGQPLLPGYVNWNAGEPNDYGVGEDCGEIAASGVWNDEDCPSARAFVCEAPLRGP